MNENDHNDGQSSSRRPADFLVTAPIDDSDPTERLSAEMSHRLADWLELIAIFEDAPVGLNAASVCALLGHSLGFIRDRTKRPAIEADTLRVPSVQHAVGEEKGVSG